MAAITRGNERSWAISLISDMNQMLRTMRLRIVRAGGESTISAGRRRMFPDVLLYADEAQTRILQGWELKLPDTPITDSAFILDAQRKAVSLGLNSCFIWNFNCGVLYVREGDDFRIEKRWNGTSHIKTREDVKRYREDWLRAIRGILLELNEYLLTGAIRAARLEAVLSDAVLSSLILRNKGLVSQHLRRAAAVDSVMEAEIAVWWTELRETFIEDERTPFDAYAKVLLLHWSNRIVFAHLIQAYHDPARQVERLTFSTSPREADALFGEITEQCDFHHIFSGMAYHDVLPDETWHDLMELNAFLTENRLSQMEQSVLQSILEQTVHIAKREVNGQFATPVILARLLVKLTVRDWSGHAMDPCCGTGTIAHALMEEKRGRLDRVEQCVETTWAADKFEFPLQIAQISLAQADTINLPSRIFRHNVFSLRPGGRISVVNPADGREICYEVPAFRSIVSNLPFVPFEIVDDADRAAIAALAARVQTETGMTLSGRSDYYMSTLFAIWNLLEPGGRLGVITSNSWLGTQAGQVFFRALSRYYRIEQIHISGAERWFHNAQVVTVITILSRRAQVAQADGAERIQFCTWGKGLSELESAPEQCETLVHSALLGRELDSDVLSLRPYTMEEIDRLQALNLSLSALFHRVRWLLELADRLVPIHQVFQVVRGERRGWDALFYPKKGHGIELVYLKRVLKNARGVHSLIAAAEGDAFCCSKSQEELRAAGHTGALDWIARFQDGVNETGVPLRKVLRRKGLHWYEMTDANAADIVTTMNPGERLFFARFKEPSFINQRLIGLKGREEYPDVALNHALLNSLLGMFYIEAVGFGRGLGALDINSRTLGSAYMLNPHLLDKAQREAVMAAFEPILHRTVHATRQELQAPDRAAFDHAVLRAYGLDRYYDDIRGSLLSVQRMRLDVLRRTQLGARRR